MAIIYGLKDLVKFILEEHKVMSGATKKLIRNVDPRFILSNRIFWTTWPEEDETFALRHALLSNFELFMYLW